VKKILMYFLVLTLTACNPSKTKLGAEFFGGITVSLSNSTLSVSNSQVATSNSTNVLLRLKDQNDAAYISTRPTITFSKSGGTSVGTLSAVTNLGDGTYSATFSGVTPGTPTTINAQVDGQAITSTLPTVQVTTGNYSLSSSTISVSAATVTSNSAVTVILTAKDASSTQLPDGGLTVAFANSGGSSTGTFSAVTDNLDGTYTATFTGVTAGTATSITVTIGGAAVTSASPTVTVNVGAATKLAFVQGPTNIASGSTISPNVTVEALDVNNNRVTAYATDIVMAIHTNPSGGTLSGTLTKTPASGVSTFNDLAINFNGTGYRLTATSGALTVAVSSTFNVSATAFTYDLPFTSITTPVYTTLYTSSSWANMEFVGNLVRLTPTVQTDTAAATGTMNSGTGSGVVIGTLTDGVNSGLKLGNVGGCNGGSSDCAKQSASEIYELNSSWTPQWANMLGYWPFNGPVGIINNGATIAANIGFTGTAIIPSGNMSYIQGQVAQGVSFQDSQADKISLGSVALNIGASFTMAGWVKIPNYRSNYQVILSKGPKNTGHFETYINITNGLWKFYSNDLGDISSGITLDDDTWKHIAISYNGANMRFYRNGIEVASPAVTGTITPESANVWFGEQTDSNNMELRGSIDDFGIWSTVLSQTEIQTIYDRQKSAYSGTFTSRVMDAKSSSSWTTLSWIPTLPFLKELPDYSGGMIQNESSNVSTGYSSLVGSTGSTGADNLMTGIVGLWHLNESAWGDVPNEVNDDSGQGNHGRAKSGASTIANGKLGRAGLFDGVNDYLDFGTFAPVKKSLSFWLSPDGTSDGAIIVDGNNAYDSAQWNMSAFFYNNVLNFRCKAGGSSQFAGITPISNTWVHFALIREDLGDCVLYRDGVEFGRSVGGALGSTDNIFRIGRAGQYFKGNLDEVAIWNRALHANEVRQLYQRGASRLKYQVRSCNDSACSGENWQGPDGTSGTYFSELNNNTTPLTGAGDVKATLPSMLFSNFTSAPSANQYFQYRTIFESDSGTAALWPELKSTTVDPIHYPKFLSTDTAPGNTIIGMNGVAFYELNAFTQLLGAGGCSNGVVYNLGLSNSGPWKYWTGVTWATANGSSAQANTAAALVASSNAALTAFAIDVGRGSVFFKAFLTSDSTTKCELDNINIGGNR
jgi:hypothetical protein